ncbi:MAG TPA: cupredoxin family copper-binding protein [Solirubrobacteraceae bacterium]
MNESLLPVRVRLAAVALVTAALVLAPAVAVDAAPHQSKHHKSAHKKKHHKHKAKKKKHKAKRKAGSAASPASAPTTTETCTTTKPYASATADPFEQHMNDAHFSRSPTEQAQDIADTSEWINVHTILVEAMAAPSLEQGDKLTTVLQEAIAPFLAHFYAAHLEQSPTQQMEALLDPSTYTLTHTVLVEQMLQPVADYFSAVLSGEKSCTTTTTPPSGGGGSAPAEAKAIAIHGHMFMPSDVTVPTGTPVTWTNDDSEPHTVVAKDGAFKSATLEKGKSYSYTFSSPGTYAYYCSVHPDMKATITAK